MIPYLSHLSIYLVIMAETLREQHRRQMEDNGVDISRLIGVRKQFHQNAEIAFNEFKTQATIMDLLKEWGLPDSAISKCVGTGLVVDIKGTAAATPDDNNHRVVAIRADMDALPMTEHNTDLEYKTQTPYAHMCGHDGHMAMLLAAAQLFCQQRDKIPENKSIRLLF